MTGDNIAVRMHVVVALCCPAATISLSIRATCVTQRVHPCNTTCICTVEAESSFVFDVQHIDSLRLNGSPCARCTLD